jgi:excisionase family DNA binding protein
MSDAVSVAVVADALGISRQAVYSRVRNGEIPGSKFGSRVLVSRAWFDQKRRSLGATPPARIELVDAGTFD